MFAKTLKPLVLICLFAIFCVTGYVVTADGEGWGFRCVGSITPKWNPDCTKKGGNGGSSSFCTGDGTLTQTSSKDCERANSNDYCKKTQSYIIAGTGKCKWIKSCTNPTLSNSTPVDDCKSKP